VRYLLVDGHSVIFAWPELRKMHGNRSGRGRNALVKILTDYQDATGIRVVAVFDGKGSKMSEETEPGGIQVFYSAGGKTADSIIERLVANYAGQHEMTVVTDDNMERQTATSFGASVMSSAELREFLAVAAKDLTRQLKELRRK
jgi:uncharacterized protein